MISKVLFLVRLAACITMAQTTPDIIVVLADDHGVYDSSPYGSAEMLTPNMQAMANEGMQFNRAYVASPACAPSRAALATGLMPYRNGIVGNHESSLSPEAPLLYQSLIDLGYEVVFKGKIAHGNNGPYVPSGVTILSGGAKPLNLTNVEDFLAARTASSKPLALFIGPKDTHLQWPDPSIARIDVNDVVIPPKSFDTPETRTLLSAYVESVERVDRTLGEVRGFIDSYLDPANTVLLYTSDHGKAWPFGKWSLYETGIRTPILAVWPGNIEANSSSRAMVSWIDILPTLIDIAGGTTPAGIDGKSFKPVLLGETGSHHPMIFATHKGDGDQNVYPIRSVRTEEWKYILNLRPDLYYTAHIDRANRHANWDSWDAAGDTSQQAAQFMIDYRSHPPEELYRVEEDPYEMINLAYDPRYADTLAMLRTVIANRMAEVGDDESLSGTALLLSDYELPAAIKLYYPNGGEAIASGSTVNVVWNAAWKGTSAVNLEYFNGVAWEPVEQDVPHSGSYSWNTSGKATVHGKFRVTSSDGNIFDESDGFFSIVNAAAINRTSALNKIQYVNVGQGTVFTGDFSGIAYLKIVNLSGTVQKNIKIKKSQDRIKWNGRNDSGHVTTAGLYVVLFYSNEKSNHVPLHDITLVKF